MFLNRKGAFNKFARSSRTGSIGTASDTSDDLVSLSGHSVSSKGQRMPEESTAGQTGSRGAALDKIDQVIAQAQDRDEEIERQLTLALDGKGSASQVVLHDLINELYGMKRELTQSKLSVKDAIARVQEIMLIVSSSEGL